jgi:hypothetical protein
MANQNGNGHAAAALEESSSRWLEWLNEELDRQGPAPRSQLLGLWDVLESWFTTNDFRESRIAKASAETFDGNDEPARVVLSAHRSRVLGILHDLTRAAGVRDPLGLARQLQVILEGTIAGALIDNEAAVSRIARDLTIIALSMRMSA